MSMHHMIYLSSKHQDATKSQKDEIIIISRCLFHKLKLRSTINRSENKININSTVHEIAKMCTGESAVHYANRS